MSTAATEKVFEESGNSVRAWLHSAEGLLASLETMRAYRLAQLNWRSFACKLDERYCFSSSPDTLNAELLLAGYSIEVLLKCLLVAKGDKLVVGGKYNGPKDHDLIKLAKQAGKSVANAESPILEFLSTLIPSIGRYPIGTTAVNTPIYWEWGSPRDDDVVSDFIRAILSEIDAQKNPRK